METNDVNFPPDQHTDLALSADAKFYLHTAAKWANFLAILGFVGTGFMVLLGLFYLVMGGAMSTAMQQSSQLSATPNPYAGLMASMGAGASLIFIGMAVLSFFFALYLYRFASSAKKAVMLNSSADMSKSIESLKSFFKLWGIVTIVYIAFVVLAFIFGILFAASMASSMHQ